MKESYGEPKLIMSRRLRRQGVRIGTFFRTKGKQNIIITAALFGLVLIFTLLNQNFISSYNIVSMAQSLAPYAVLSLGVTFVIATGGIDLSIGTVCIASAVIAGKLYMDGMPLWATIPIMILIGTIFGLINGFLVAKLKLPAFIATLGTMMFARGLSAIIVSIPNIFFPSGTLFNSIFSNANGFPSGLVWVVVLMLLCMYLMFKNKIGRYILSIGSNEEATRLSGINTDKYKIIAYTISGIFAGLAAIFWAASFATVASATGNGMELDAIAGVYIGGTSAAGG
ncbi:MAG: ABC transporter permease, partial [Clostridia bacterium]